jgi:Copper type II ascorbate-dependent monooxygenase, C-terminal domain
VQLVRVVLVGLVAGACLAACGGGGKSGPVTGPVTYYKDVLPLVSAHCGGCHASGGFAPFSLTSYDEARGYAALAAAATQSGEMPPWPPAAGCGDFADARTLSADEIAVFAAWNQAGAPAGDPSAAAAAPTAGVDLGPPSVTLDPGESYRPNAATSDDYHCFLVDPGLASAQDLVGFDVHPGTPTSVHHVLVFAVPPDAVAQAQSKDAAEPGLGWTCFAGSGLGTAADAPPTIGGWVPGAGASAFPAGTGIRLDAGTWIVVQVHYNLLAGAAFADRTTVDLHYAATPVAKRALVLPISNATFVIPPGASDTVTAELPVPVGSWSVWGVLPHMHLHGTEIRLSVEHAAGDATCAIDIRHWNFHWQGFYYYKQPLPVGGGDVVRLTCRYDNTAGSTALTWGEKTTDEMCLAFAYVTAR